MQNQTPNDVLDTPPTEDGDSGFDGYVSRGQPEELPPRILAGARNIRCRNGEAETRKGVIKPGWCNRVIMGDSKIYPWGTIYGVSPFKDPSSVRWLLIAADGSVFRSRENNAPFALPMPHASVQILADCTLIQAFNKVYLFRGRHFNPLVMPDIDTGFQDILPYWDAAATYALNKEVAYGPFQTVSTLTGNGGMVTAVCAAPHGYVTALDVVIQGATNAEYNGRFAITVIDDVTFRYSAAITHATGGGTPKVSDMSRYFKTTAATAAGESPDTTPAKWTQIHNILPRADDALYINNRLLIPTWYTPLSDGFTLGNGGYTKKDFLVATDVQDEIHFDFLNEFRINQGSDDEIVGLCKFNDDTVIVFKEKSWGVLSNIRLDLSNVTLDMRNTLYGASAPRSFVTYGGNAYFMSQKLGVVNLAQSEFSKLQGVDIPLSYEIQPDIEKILWRYGNKIRLAFWDNKLYVAASTASSLTVPTTSLPNGIQDYTTTAAGNYVTEHWQLEPGAIYHFSGGSSTGLYQNGQLVVRYGDIFMAGGDGVYTATYFDNGHGPAISLPIVAFVSVPTQINNTIFVYDFQTRHWCSMDTGAALCVKEFFVYTVGGVERLFFAGEDGSISLVEESTDGDAIISAGSPIIYFINGGQPTTGIIRQQIADYRLTRGYKHEMIGLKKMRAGQIVIGTWNPQFTVKKIESGVNRTATLFADKTKSNTKYYRPFNAPAFNTSNVNDDAQKPNRQDYSVRFPNGGMYFGSGIWLTIFQQSIESFHINSQARYAQFEISNNQGALKLKAIELEALPGARRKGTLT